MAERVNRTRERLVDTALRLFREEGFKASTMRRIADEAGVSLGNAYYYFESKDELVHELYLEIQREHRSIAQPLLVSGAPLQQNLRVVLLSGIDVMGPYHDFGSSFVQAALPIGSKASPFSAESAQAREMAIELMSDAVKVSRVRVPAILERQLPSLLWLAYLGITLHWVADSSPGQTRTRALVESLVPVIAKAISLSRMPMASGLITDIVRLLANLDPTIPRTEAKS